MTPVLVVVPRFRTKACSSLPRQWLVELDALARNFSSFFFLLFPLGKFSKSARSETAQDHTVFHDAGKVTISYFLFILTLWMHKRRNFVLPLIVLSTLVATCSTNFQVSIRRLKASRTLYCSSTPKESMLLPDPVASSGQSILSFGIPLSSESFIAFQLYNHLMTLKKPGRHFILVFMTVGRPMIRIRTHPLSPLSSLI